jgi:hypothetical protein
MVSAVHTTNNNTTMLVYREFQLTKEMDVGCVKVFLFLSAQQQELQTALPFSFFR